MRKLYIAYGSNLNLRQMSLRCPNAKPVGSAILKGWQLLFRGVATIEEKMGAEVPVGVWEITPTCEMALDRYEGYPQMYRKEELEIQLNGKNERGMIYIMNGGRECMPSRGYFETILEGYDDVGLDAVYLKEAIEYTKNKMQG